MVESYWLPWRWTDCPTPSAKKYQHDSSSDVHPTQDEQHCTDNRGLPDS
tara:strand:- start:36 stop:182 length:147 start_codon:yes stop_codon:yes gene_type:complete